MTDYQTILFEMDIAPALERNGNVLIDPTTTLCRMESLIQLPARIQTRQNALQSPDGCPKKCVKPQQSFE